MLLQDVLAVLREMAPEETALDKDPVGLLISRDGAEVTKIGVCLDATPETAARAASEGVELLLAHHPLIYQPLQRLQPESDPIARAVTTLIKGNVALYAMHTNWDRAAGGINDVLAEMLELQNAQPLGTEGAATLPRIGDLTAPRPLVDFARFVEMTLNCAGTSSLRVNAVDPAKMISRVAVCGGAGAFLAEQAMAAGAQAYVTSDVRHHEFLDAQGRGLALLDAGHAATETPGMRALVRFLPARLESVEVLWVGED